MNLLSALLLLFSGLAASAISAAPANAADEQSSVSTNSASTSRYEIIQSEIAAKETFLADKFCGAVSELVTDNEGHYHWQSMAVENLKPCVNDGRSHYQLFSSGIAVKFTFLINTSNSTTWILVTDSKQNRSWELLQ